MIMIMMIIIIIMIMIIIIIIIIIILIIIILIIIINIVKTKIVNTTKTTAMMIMMIMMVDGALTKKLHDLKIPPAGILRLRRHTNTCAREACVIGFRLLGLGLLLSLIYFVVLTYVCVDDVFMFSFLLSS